MTSAPNPPARPLAVRRFEQITLGTELWHVHDSSREANSFFDGAGHNPTRFAPIYDDRTGRAIPVLYAGLQQAGALFETVFHDVPERGPRSVHLARLRNRSLTRLEIGQDARCADLTKSGLPSLGTTRVELIESDSARYSTTAMWSEAIHNDNTNVQGLFWISRPNDRFGSAMFFGDRIDASEFATDPDSMPLDRGEGLDLVAEWADTAEITLI